MKKKMYIFIISLITLSIMGCGERGSNEEQGGDDKGNIKGTIGVSVLTLGNPFLA